MGVKPVAHGGNAARIDAIDAPCSVRLIGHQAGFSQHAQMLRDGGATDRQTACQITDGRRPRGDTLENGPAGRVRQGSDTQQGTCSISHGLP